MGRWQFFHPPEIFRWVVTLQNSIHILKCIIFSWSIYSLNTVYYQGIFKGEKGKGTKSVFIFLSLLFSLFSIFRRVGFIKPGCHGGRGVAQKTYTPLYPLFLEGNPKDWNSWTSVFYNPLIPPLIRGTGLWLCHVRNHFHSCLFVQIRGLLFGGCTFQDGIH